MIHHPTHKYSHKRNKNLHSHKNLYVNVSAVLFIIAKNWKQANFSSNGKWIHTQTYVYIYICTYMYVHTYMYIYTCVCVYEISLQWNSTQQ